MRSLETGVDTHTHTQTSLENILDRKEMGLVGTSRDLGRGMKQLRGNHTSILNHKPWQPS